MPLICTPQFILGNTVDEKIIAQVSGCDSSRPQSAVMKSPPSNLL